MPVGVPAPGATAATVAVNVTCSPMTDGFGEAVTIVVVLALLTVSWNVLTVVWPMLSVTVTVTV